MWSPDHRLRSSLQFVSPSFARWYACALQVRARPQYHSYAPNFAKAFITIYKYWCLHNEQVLSLIYYIYANTRMCLNSKKAFCMKNSIKYYIFNHCFVARLKAQYKLIIMFYFIFSLDTRTALQNVNNLNWITIGFQVMKNTYNSRWR